MTNNVRRKYAVSILLMMMVAWLAPVHTAAQDSLRNTKEVINAQMVSLGGINLLDTYLSPEKYNGFDIRYISHTTRFTPGKRWAHRIVHYGTMAGANDRNEKGSLTEGLYTLDAAFVRQYDLFGKRLHLLAGGMTDFNFGAVYNARNQNNPAQVRMSMQIGPTASARYDFSLFRRPFSLNYEVAVPLVGLMFSPNYGQSYYEIFSLGNYDHNVVVTTPFNAPSLRQMLTLDFKLFGSHMRIGYLGDIQQAKANNLKQHAYTHSLVIGYVRNLRITYK